MAMRYKGGGAVSRPLGVMGMRPGAKPSSCWCRKEMLVVGVVDDVGAVPRLEGDGVDDEMKVKIGRICRGL